MQPALLSAVGQDDEGDELIRACTRLGLIGAHIYRSEDLPTDRYMAVEGGNGLIAAIADAHSLEAAGDKILRPLTQGALLGWDKIVALDGNLTAALLEQIAHAPAFAQTDLRVAPASPGKAERLMPFLSGGQATLYVNTEEAALLLHRPVASAADAAEALRDKGAHRPRPASIAFGDTLITRTPPEVLVTRVTGAGDTFMAAHIAAEAQGTAPQAALDRALTAAAIYISGETYK